MNKENLDGLSFMPHCGLSSLDRAIRPAINKRVDWRCPSFSRLFPRRTNLVGGLFPLMTEPVSLAKMGRAEAIAWR